MYTESSYNTLNNKALQLDEQDALAKVKNQFCLPKNVVYLDGNSLGPLSIKAKERALEVVNQQWGEDLIASWNKHQWIDLPKQIGNKIAPLIGAQANSVVCCDSISVNLFKLLSAALKMNQNNGVKKRTKIVSQQDNFPTDLYMVQGLRDLVGANNCELLSVSAHEIISTLEQQGEDIAVLMLTHVNFRNGDIHDMQAITQIAHQAGILVIWDLAHSAGVLPLNLHEYDVDFAVGCTYKYLNGGPGSPGFAYVAPRLHSLIEQPLSGWMGHKKPFEFTHDYLKADGIEQLLCGTPSIISMSILDAALAVFEDVNLQDIRAKSIALNGFFQEALDTLLASAHTHEAKHDLELACNISATERGSQISYQHENAYEICQALIAQGVVADFRAPKVLRIGFSPLFLSFSDILKAAQILAAIISDKTYEHAEFKIRQAVT